MRQQGSAVPSCSARLKMAGTLPPHTSLKTSRSSDMLAISNTSLGSEDIFYSGYSWTGLYLPTDWVHNLDWPLPLVLRGCFTQGLPSLPLQHGTGERELVLRLDDQHDSSDMIVNMITMFAVVRGLGANDHHSQNLITWIITSSIWPQFILASASWTIW